MAPTSTLRKPQRLGFLEAMEMSRLPSDDSSPATQRFMSHRPAWQPGAELPWDRPDVSEEAASFRNFKAYGGHVYIQAPLAAARIVEAKEEEEANRTSREYNRGKFGIHSIQGVFTYGGYTDRPFIYSVSKLSSGRSFQTCLVTVRQPTQTSATPRGPFPLSDANLPLGPICFSCHVTFKRPAPNFADEQLTSAQERFAHILSRRRPDEWEASPQLDMDILNDLFPNEGHGGFPIVDMYKVDMSSWNADKPISERRELLLYRLHKPVPAEDANAHVLCHAFEADRNGLLTIGNHLGWGYNLAVAASLSYTFLVHVNAEEAVMKDGWWIQEVCWPRVSAGRAVLESRIWSPEGRHVASGYQDGLTAPREGKRATEKL
ncbi:Thioesterase/thiol ester dehydrase-isomerase [Trichoderma citrinoviride]|uniref:Thioesterase/thiol ester dehydrase-isomerase n=1 Tax=Trichoderma citrinoviride TaxID=58853 RepID=A0A2T4BA03_9HYPO|nr:Thioesterase/thiol ester dehydrase-isomerase [Trichoderma citrinoviride]PTB66163.1 Thioesterase/thiol ester dehydrase-isomerase [Trichoderma citrinoviride]